MVQRYDVDWNLQEYEDDEGPWVTYEDYQKLEAELKSLRQQVKAPDADGWIEWGGGECPVGDGTLIGVKYRSGYAVPDCEPELQDWEHSGFATDIIAYRIV